MAGDIDMGHARLPLDGAAQIGLANLIAARGLSVREAERLYIRPQPEIETARSAPDRDILRLEEEIADQLGATVKIKANNKGAPSPSTSAASINSTACSTD
jgi:ParB family chromosome partitioning protein